jgi:hypothetical protein
MAIAPATKRDLQTVWPRTGRVHGSPHAALQSSQRICAARVAICRVSSGVARRV